MSLASRIAIAISVAFTGVVLGLLAASREHFGLAIGCAVIAAFVVVSCFTSGRLGRFTGSVLALAGVVGLAAYLSHEIMYGTWVTASPGGASIANAALAFVIFGPACAIYLWRAAYPTIGGRN